MVSSVPFSLPLPASLVRVVVRETALPKLRIADRAKETDGSEEKRGERWDHQIALALISLSETSETGSCHPL